MCLGVGLIPIRGTPGGKNTLTRCRRAQRGTRRTTWNTGWQTGLQAQKEQIVIRRKWEKCCQEREVPIFYPLLDEAGWTEAAARTIGGGHQGNPCRAAIKPGWGQGRLCHCGEQPSCSLSLGRAERADPVWTHGSAPDKLLRFQCLCFPLGQPLPDSLRDIFTATFCHFAT